MQVLLSLHEEFEKKHRHMLESDSGLMNDYPPELLCIILMVSIRMDTVVYLCIEYNIKPSPPGNSNLILSHVFLKSLFNSKHIGGSRTLPSTLKTCSSSSSY